MPCPFFECGLNELCGIWKGEPKIMDKDTCTFSTTDFVKENRNSQCPFPVELVLSNLKEVK